MYYVLLKKTNPYNLSTLQRSEDNKLSVYLGKRTFPIYCITEKKECTEFGEIEQPRELVRYMYK